VNSTREKSAKDLGLIYCDKCGYCNRVEMISKYGTCRGCLAVLDEKAKFKYEMNKKLRLWKNDKNMRRNYFIKGD
jgi:hypothetical protein